MQMAKETIGAQKMKQIAKPASPSREAGFFLADVLYFQKTNENLRSILLSI